MMRNSTAIRVKRVIKGLTIRELAKAVNIHESTMSRVELARQDASRRLQTALADFFQCDSAELFENERGRALEYRAV